MARRVILDTQYTFNPATRTIVIPRIIPQERLLLITNVTNNTVIYNFSDSALTATSYTTAQGGNATNATTTIVLAYNTTLMSASHKLQIVVDEPAELFVPDEAYQDPVGKLRVSTPQALIDTDFEYGLQPTKWETLTLLNNKPSFFINTQNPLSVANVTATYGFANINVTLTSGITPPANGTPFYMQDSLFAGGNGPFVVEASNNALNSFAYTARYNYNGITGSIFNSGTPTLAYTGSFFSNAQIDLAAQPTIQGGANLVFTTRDPHGLQIGDGVFVVNATTTTGGPVNGSYQIASVANATVFTIVTTTAPGGTVTSANVYPRPDGVYIHRAFDGGVQFTTGNPAHNNQTIRQTRRYFRYQSGKGIQISTGTIFEPNMNVDDLTTTSLVANASILATMKNPHQLNPGVRISVQGANESAFNVTNTAVTSVINQFAFTYTANGTPTSLSASGIPTVSAVNWYGATTRVGLFDNQNGVFFEYDGQQIWAVRRRTTDQLSGSVNVTAGSGTVLGATVNNVSTKFSRQLVPGDYISIRGMSYRVLDVLSDTQMTITPPYRGPSLLGQNSATVSKTVEVRVPQGQWNIDRMDGTGPSGMNLDFTKMQMFYIDYSWYGAGAVRFGFRDTQGRVSYCHRFVNNNLNYEAWMRSGNLPARYEATTFAPKTTLGASINATANTLQVANTAGFPNSGILLIANPLSYEYVNYTGISGNTFTGLTRGQYSNTIVSVQTIANNATLSTTSAVSNVQPGMLITGTGIPKDTYIYSIIPGSPNNSIILTQAPVANGTITANVIQMGSYANTHAYIGTNPIGVYLHAPQISPQVSHWGTSVMMDGRFDDDKSLQFTYGETASTNVIAGSAAGITTTSGAFTFTATNTVPFFPGMLVSSANLPSGTIITSVSPGNPNTITLNKAATASGSTTITYNGSVALMSVRVSPAVDSGIPGTLGLKEIVNRMQLTLDSVAVMASGSFLIQLLLNGIPIAPGITTTGYAGALPVLNNFDRIAVGTSSIAQVSDHTGPCYVNGGESMFSFYVVNSAGSTNQSVVTADLSKIRDLGNSILGGGLSNVPGTGVYPDGPDILTIVATNIGSAPALVQARLSWTEAQA